MTGPAYLLATVTTVIAQDPRNPKLHHMNNIQPPVVKLFPLPMQISRQQARDASSGEHHAELELGAIIVRTLESFDDVLKAISDAGKAGEPIARPIGRGRIAGAVQASLPGGQGSQKDELAELRAKMQQINREVIEADIRKTTGIEDAAKGMPEDQRKNTLEEVRADLERRAKAPASAEKIARAQEGAKHQDEPVSWDQFVQTDGENTGAPAPKAGDLRIAQYDQHGQCWIEVAKIEEDGVDWVREGVPPELMPVYADRDLAHASVKLAGYSRRLITYTKE